MAIRNIRNECIKSNSECERTGHKALGKADFALWYLSPRQTARQLQLAPPPSSTLIAAPATGNTSQVCSTGSPLTASTACA
jgi:hypothetical protein